MAVSLQSISTAGISRSDRPAYWAEALGNLVGKVDVFPLSAEIHGSMDLYKLGRLHMAAVEGCNTRLSMGSTGQGKPRKASIHLLFQQEGTSLLEQDGQSFEIGPGDCMAYDFERPHRITSPGAVRLHSLCIPRELVTERGFDLRRMSPVMLTRDPAVEIAGELIGSILGRWSRITAESQAAMADALLGVLMPPLVRQIGSLRPMGHAELLRERALAFIAKNLDDPELGVGYIARVLGCTRRYLHMSFAETGTTASRTIWQMRLERARHSLSEPSAKSLSVTEIAFACGFSSSAHFSRLFKERFGCSPSQARLPETPG